MAELRKRFFRWESWNGRWMPHLYRDNPTQYDRPESKPYLGVIHEVDVKCSLSYCIDHHPAPAPAPAPKDSGNDESNASS